MNLTPKRKFSWLNRCADFINPYIVIVSAAGLILEFTVYKTYVININRITDIVFVFYFLFKLVSLPTGKYFFRNYGWVDMLACLPAASAYVNIFRITRILRFLRVFSFIRSINIKSRYISERIMKTGVPVVILIVLAAGAADFFLAGYLIKNKTAYYTKIYELSRKKVEVAAQRDPGIIYFTENLKLFTASGAEVSDFDDYLSKRDSFHRWHVEVNLTGQVIDYQGVPVPVRGLLADGYDIMIQHDRIMLVMGSLILFVFILIIFYVRSIYVRDLKIIELLNDSFDAGDFWLLREEARRAGYENEEGLNELMILFLRLSAVSEKLEISDSLYNLHSADRRDNKNQEDAFSMQNEVENILSRLDCIERKIDEIPDRSEAQIKAVAGESASKAVKIASRSIGEYILKILVRPEK